MTTTKKPRKRRSRILLDCLVVAGVLFLSGVGGTVVGLIKGIVAVGDEVSADPARRPAFSLRGSAWP